MNKNFAKTIMSLIVFVVFLGLVNLDDVQARVAECEYSFGDGLYFTIRINNEGGLSNYAFWDDTYNSGDFFDAVSGGLNYTLKNGGNLEIRNWGAFYPDKKTGASGASYYINNGKTCPPNVLYVETLSSHAIVFLNGDDKYEDIVEDALSEEDKHIHSQGKRGKKIISGLKDFAGKSTIFLHNKIMKGATFIKNLWNDTDEEYDELEYHITYKFDCTAEKYTEQPDPDDVVVDDGKEREWQDPTVRPVDPLDEDKVKYSCGNGTITGIPARIPKFGKFLYNFLQFLVPIVLVLLGTIDLIKSIVGSKEDDIKKNQTVFIKRLVSAIVIFFSFALVKLILSIVSEDSANIIQCVDCILRNSSNCIKEN